VSIYFGGAVPGGSEYVPFLQGLMLPYDDPDFGGLVSILGTAGLGSFSSAELTTAETSITNPVSSTLARVVPGNINPVTLGAPGEEDVFITNASELTGLSPAQIAQKLTIPESPYGFNIVEFPTSSVTGIATPIGRTNPGFIGGGQTAGGASEFVIPNSLLPPGSTIRFVP